jgi:hypothetical protein
MKSSRAISYINVEVVSETSETVPVSIIGIDVMSFVSIPAQTTWGMVDTVT